MWLILSFSKKVRDYFKNRVIFYSGIIIQKNKLIDKIAVSLLAMFFGRRRGC